MLRLLASKNVFQQPASERSRRIEARRYSGEHGLVYDVVEPLRPLVDQKLLEFVRRQKFAAGDFTLLSNGICRLNPQLARNVVREIDASGDVGKVVDRFVKAPNRR